MVVGGGGSEIEKTPYPAINQLIARAYVCVLKAMDMKVRREFKTVRASNLSSGLDLSAQYVLKWARINVALRTAQAPLKVRTGAIRPKR